MAISAAVIGAIGSVAGVAQSMDSSRRARHGVSDAENARKKAEADASNNANARIKMQRQAMADNSLLTGGGAASAPGQTLGV